MDKRLLQILRCPVTHKGLSLARRETIGRVNAAIKSGILSNRDGTLLTETLDEALVTDDSKLLYPIANGIPVLLEGESVRLDQLEAY
ncbi:MAG TPA: Trm112 family protein [Woeseiaceae bacterium]|nr:Trm112 family protein [Woeseiaceae bacterium]